MLAPRPAQAARSALTNGPCLEAHRSVTRPVNAESLARATGSSSFVAFWSTASASVLAERSFARSSGSANFTCSQARVAERRRRSMSVPASASARSSVSSAAGSPSSCIERASASRASALAGNDATHWVARSRNISRRRRTAASDDWCLRRSVAGLRSNDPIVRIRHEEQRVADERWNGQEAVALVLAEAKP